MDDYIPKLNKGYYLRDGRDYREGENVGSGSIIFRRGRKTNRIHQSKFPFEHGNEYQAFEEMLRLASTNLGCVYQKFMPANKVWFPASDYKNDEYDAILLNAVKGPDGCYVGRIWSDKKKRFVDDLHVHTSLVTHEHKNEKGEVVMVETLNSRYLLGNSG
jgi:hypothetical protein